VTAIGHNDDVTALCVSYSRKWVASGQNGQKPMICIWDSVTGEIRAKKYLPKGSRLVTAIGISANDKYVVATDAADKVTAFIFDIEGGADPIGDVGINYVVTNINCSLTDDNVFATCGKNHLMYCQFDGKKLSKKTGKPMKGGEIPNMCSVAFSAQAGGILYSGGADGQIHQFAADQVTKTYQNNKGSVYTLAVRNDGQSEVLLVGGSDKTISCYQIGQKGALTKAWTLPVDAAPRSLDL
jgi:WD40 repeat protein